jgi:hypothetical protein
MNDLVAQHTTPGMQFLRRSPASRGPLTFQQLFLWDYFNLKSGRCPRGAIAFQINGPLDGHLLARSLNEVVRRHDSLRTRIVMTDDALEQHVDDEIELDLEVIDLTSLAEKTRETQAREFIREFAMDGGDLAGASPIAAALIRMVAQEHILVLGIHHVAADAIGLGRALDDFWSVCVELLQGMEPHPTRTTARYLEYARWQHATHHDWLQEHEGYWKDRIADAVRVDWPAHTRPAKAERVYAGFEVVGMPSLAALRQVARSTGTIPAIVMFSIYAAVIARWCGQSAFTIPLNAAGRHRPELEHAVGYFAQFLCLNVKIARGQTFLELLARLSQEFQGALAHQDFGKVAAQIPEVLLGSKFSWEGWRLDTFGLPTSSAANEFGFTVRRLPLVLTATPGPDFQGIGAFFYKADGEYSTVLRYRTDEFSTSEVGMFAWELRTLSERVVKNPHCLPLESRNS